MKDIFNQASNILYCHLSYCAMLKTRVSHPPPKIITKMDYDYFRSRAHEGLLSDKMKETSCNDVVKAKENLMAESMARRAKIREIDMKKLHEKSLKLSKLDEEAKAQTMQIIERAENLQIEQEEEILLCNKLILETKCRAIRDLQVAEKKLIEEELQNEDKRLDKVMENKEKIIIEAEKREAAKNAAKQRIFTRLLKNQIMENEEQRIIEFERKQEEAKLSNLNNIAWQEEEIRKANKIKQQNELMKKQMALENTRLIKVKEIEREENRILDMRIRKFQQEKEERDKKIAETCRLIKAKKDAERMRIGTKTMQKYNMQAQIDELNIERVREEVEREWRNREKIAALKKLEEREKFIKAMEEQIKCRETLQTMEMERDRREFDRVLEIQKKTMEREEKEIEKQQCRAAKYRYEILKQIDEKAKEKLAERKKVIEEGLAINMQIQMRKNKLKNAMEKKCNEMRKNKVPEIYINNVKMLIDKIK